MRVKIIKKRSIILMIICVLLYAVMVQGENYISPDGFLYTWLNSDPNTKGLTKLVIYQNGTDLIVHAHGSVIQVTAIGELLLLFTMVSKLSLFMRKGSK